MLRTAVVIGLAALYDTVEGSSHDLFALDADGCVVNYQEKCAAQGTDPLHLQCVHRITCSP